MTDINTCTGCLGSDLSGHTGDCESTWQNPTWVNREQVYSHRVGHWVWREIKNTTPAKVVQDLAPTEGSLHIRDLKEEIKFIEAMKNWTEEEVAELLGA